MRRGPRLIAVAGVALVLGVVAAAPAQAAPEDWAGSRITSPATTSDATPQITAVLTRGDFDTNTNRIVATTQVAAPGGLPAGCSSSLNGTGDHGAVARQPGTLDHPTTATLTIPLQGAPPVRTGIPAVGVAGGA